MYRTRCTVLTLLLLVGTLPLLAADPAWNPRIAALDIRISLDPERGLIHEETSLTIQGTAISRLSFRIDPNLVVERSAVDRGVVEHRKAGDTLHLTLDPPVDGSRRVTLTLSGRPRRGSLDLVGPGWAVLGGSDDWYPRHPGTWGPTRVVIKAPGDWVAVGPGSRVPGNTPGEWEWRSSEPVRNVAVAAAPSLTLTEAMAVKTPVRVASPTAELAADDTVTDLRDPLAWMSGALAPYPFDGLNLVLIPELPLRAQGSGVVIVPADVPVTGRGNAAALISAQWFGERLAGDGPWIEAFAAWQAVVYARDRSQPLPMEIADLRADYMDLSPSRDVPLSRAERDSPACVVRGKGSAAPDMVRLNVGDRRFYQAVGDLFSQPPGPEVSLQDVRSVFERRAGNPLIRPFSDWFDRRGIPSLEISFRTMESATGGWRTDLGIVQLRGVYKLPVEVVFVGVGQEHRETILIEEETTSVFYVLPFETKRIEVDPLGRIFQHPWRRAGEGD